MSRCAARIGQRWMRVPRQELLRPKNSLGTTCRRDLGFVNSPPAKLLFRGSCRVWCRRGHRILTLVLSRCARREGRVGCLRRLSLPPSISLCQRAWTEHDRSLAVAPGLFMLRWALLAFQPRPQIGSRQQMGIQIHLGDCCSLHIEQRTSQSLLSARWRHNDWSHARWLSEGPYHPAVVLSVWRFLATLMRMSTVP